MAAALLAATHALTLLPAKYATNIPYTTQQMAVAIVTSGTKLFLPLRVDLSWWTPSILTGRQLHLTRPKAAEAISPSLSPETSNSELSMILDALPNSSSSLAKTIESEFK